MFKYRAIDKKSNMTFVEDDSKFWEPDLMLDGSQFFDHTFSFRNEDFATILVDQVMPPCNIEGPITPCLESCDCLLDWPASACCGAGWVDAATDDFHATLQASHPSLAFDDLAGNWPGDVLLANPISQQELKATTPNSISSTSPSSIDVPVVK